jgi:hypothetical protein
MPARRVRIPAVHPHAHGRGPARCTAPTTLHAVPAYHPRTPYTASAYHPRTLPAAPAPPHGPRELGADASTTTPTLCTHAAA